MNCTFCVFKFVFASVFVFVFVFVKSPFGEATRERGAVGIVLCDRVLARGALAVARRIVHLKMNSLKI